VLPAEEIKEKSEPAGINFKQIEEKWQKIWEERKVFAVKEENKKKKFYCLEMFPYPSGSGLHMGHAFNYSIGDIYTRFKRMNGFNVLYPMGYDSFGLPAENAAVKAQSHPKIFTEQAIENFVRQQKSLGLSYDWERKLMTHSPEYYRWNQYFFLKLFEKGLVYRKKSPVNYCPKCETVLANEQVHNGKCWRHGNTDIELKQLEQWFIKTTAYAEELLKDMDKLQWPERIKSMQRNWIGKSHGTEILFIINGEKWPIFTTRPDTIFGVTFMVVSAQHPRLMELVTDKEKKHVETFLKKLKSTKQEDMDIMEKEGVFTGSYAVNPMTKEKVPVYAGNFVVADYGSGMVMAVPAHDQRDFEFAKKYDLSIKQVICENWPAPICSILDRAYTENGCLVASEKFSGLKNEEAKEKITKYLEEKRSGKRVVQYKLRDWLVSRQRYWGTPIPFVYCEKCGVMPVPERDLPIKLPENVKFGQGNPLESNKEFVETKCPQCKGKARREKDTMDTFFDSSWYYLRYCDNKNDKKPFDASKTDYWMPVDQYIGGAEHACMHLIYARFFTKALRDLGFLKFDEPFIRLFNQGMLHGPDGAVMSKSRGNVVLPETVSAKYGMDTARLFLVSIASPDKDIEWSDSGIEGSLRFINRVFEYFGGVSVGNSSKRAESKTHKAIKEITQDIETFQYNLAVIKIRALFDALNEETEINRMELESFLKLLHPICPHITEELWHRLGNKTLVSLESWPVFDPSKIDEKLEQQEHQIENTINDIKNIFKIIREKQGKEPQKAYLYVIPPELKLYKEAEGKLKNSLNVAVEVFANNNHDKHDPENKAVKAKFGKPGIYVV
ncbi:MAG TPA: leucine--tRNA ligase, partial [Candidatus Nanoarchaeia archaeon]|nr:leucine--tRNA ligase [Candidatus Nanoarchaeia archaeon]